MFLRSACAWGLAISMVFGVPSALAGKMELTTYYPAPYGEYKQLKAQGAATDPETNLALQAGGSTGTGLVVTNGNNVGIGLAAATLPAANLEVNNTIRFTPTDTAPSSPVKGSCYYSDTGNTLRCYDGNQWNSFFSEGWDRFIFKGADTGRTSETFSMDPDLNFSVSRGEVWMVEFEGLVFGDNPAFRFEIPCVSWFSGNCTEGRGFWHIFVGDTTTGALADSSVRTMAVTLKNPDDVMTYNGATRWWRYAAKVMFFIVGDGGTLSVDWRSVNGNNVILKKGSFLHARRLS